MVFLWSVGCSVPNFFPYFVFMTENLWRVRFSQFFVSNDFDILSGFRGFLFDCWSFRNFKECVFLFGTVCDLSSGFVCVFCCGFV